MMSFNDALGDTADSQYATVNTQLYFTGKPEIPGLGRAFLMRNYRADLGKWQTADPFGYPDGWNQMVYCGNEVSFLLDIAGAKSAHGYTSWNERQIQVCVGMAPWSTISHQIWLYETRTVHDSFEVTIPYEGVNNGGVADIAVGQITGKWSFYGVYNDSPDRDGMSTSIGWSFLFIKIGRTYFAKFGPPDVQRSNENRSVTYTYTFDVYSCEYIGGDVPLPKGFSISTGWQTDLPGLEHVSTFSVTLRHQIAE